MGFFIVNYTKRENSRNAIPLFMLRTVKLFLVVFKYSSLAKNSQTRNSYCFFLSVMPPKDLAPFSYISHKKTIFQR